MDPWWNPFCEDQAIDRVHRVGQTKVTVQKPLNFPFLNLFCKPVRVTRYIIRESIEETILTLQATKREMAQNALTRITPSQNKTQRIAGMKEVFKLT